jgi:hypothetical protein
LRALTEEPAALPRGIFDDSLALIGTPIFMASIFATTASGITILELTDLGMMIEGKVSRTGVLTHQREASQTTAAIIPSHPSRRMTAAILVS